jgi:hypothetical protein
VLAERAPQTTARPHHLEDVERVPHVEPEGSEIAKLARRLRVMTQAAGRSRDLDTAYEVEPAQALHRTGRQPAFTSRGDIRIVVKKERDAPLSRVEQVGYVARKKAHRILDIGDRERCDHRGGGPDLERKVQVLQRLRRVGPRDADPGLDRPVPRLLEPGVRLAYLFHDHLTYASATPHIEVVPLARRAHDEDDIRAAPGLDQVARQSPLVLPDGLPIRIEDGDTGDR